MPGLLVLCEVALGSPHELENADYQAHRLPPGRNSVQGVGTYRPQDTARVTM